MAEKTWSEEMFDELGWENSYRTRIGQLEEALRAVEATDRSAAYEYGEADRNGKKPEAGQRWNTPREIARDVLREKAASS